MPIPALLAAVAFGALAAPSAGVQEAQPSAALRPVPHAELAAQLRAVEAAHSDLVRVFPIGRSRGGRELLAVRLSPGDPPPGRPALLVVANVDGPQAFSSAVAAWEVGELARRYANDETVRALLETTTLYFVPRANPDAAEARFGSPLFAREASGHGFDDDRDGRDGEDPPADVDGDGLILSMRVEDPEGTWIEDPTDPRAMVEADAKKGERGRWKVYVEGRDADGDERVAEDDERDTWLNRNFPQDWREHEPSAGLFPMDEPEARALAEFLLAHRDVAAVVTYGWQDTLVEKPKSVRENAPANKRVPAPGVIEPDADLLVELGRRYAKLVEKGTKGSGQDDGSFQSWIYHQRGLLPINVALWDIPLDTPAPKPEEPEEEESEEAAEEQAPPEEAPKGAKKAKDDAPEPGDDAKRLRWVDAEGEGERFVDWKPFEHPELGAVEIGGFRPFARLEPPAAEAARIAGAQLEFLISLGELLARVEVTRATAHELGAGLVEVEAVLTNRRLFPLRFAGGERSRSVRPARVRLLIPDGAELLAGDSQELVRQLDGSGGRAEFRWLVRGAPAGSMGIAVDTDHAGTAQVRPEVKP